MKFLCGLGTFLMLGALTQGCSTGSADSSESNRTGGSSGEHVGEMALALTGACTFDTLGLPCDPDGPANPARLECEGVCAIAGSGYVACQGVTVGTNDGIVCGNAGAVGSGACARRCSGKTCLNSPAAAGAACRPTSDSSPCDGRCDGSGHCDAVADPCTYGRDEQLCKFATCDLTDVSQCVDQNLRANVLCSPSDACSLGRCNNAGVCVPGPTVGCDDGNACTDDACDPDTGGCIGTADDDNSCSDFNACTTGDFCAAGTCQAGVTARDCDDGNACTADSCDPNTGCAHVAKSCNDSDACTDDSCDSTSGVCSNVTKSCDDSNLCTTDSCDTVIGCVFLPLNCDDGNACTQDSCFGGSCSSTVQSCDDSNDCTLDSCDTANGCSNVPIDSPACNPSGEGGAGGVPSDGGAPGAGAANEGGVPNGGVAGEASGGGPNATAGDDSGGTAGSTPVAGTAGSTSGASSMGAQGNSGAAPGEGGDGAQGPARSADSSGCGCVVPAAPVNSGAAWALALVAAVLLRRRRAA